MAKDYEILKKHYGEKFAQFCRANFPTILQKGDGVLADIIMSLFDPNRDLIEDIICFERQNEFKEYVYSKFFKTYIKKENEQKKLQQPSPQELMRAKGYTLYKCDTPEQVNAFKKYWAKNETLCTFNNVAGRLARCHIFFAVKDGAENLDREAFKTPRRQDEYGTSVISLQFAKEHYNSLSIKNRYNHSVENPDATFSNNLENICPGLTDSFIQHYGYNLKDITGSFELPLYTKDTEGKMYRYNLESDGIYYCPNNVIIKDGVASRLDPTRYVLIENYILDYKDKTISLAHNTQEKEDSFVQTLQNIENIQINKNKDGKTIKITQTDGNIAYLQIDKGNRLIEYSNHAIKSVGHKFLSECVHITKFDIPNMETCGDQFLMSAAPPEINLPKLKKCGNSFLKHLQGELIDINLPNLEKCGNDFLRNNISLKQLSLPKLKECGTGFLYFNENINHIYLPNLAKCGVCFMRENTGLIKIDLPNLEYCGGAFLVGNQLITEVNLPKLKECGDNCLYSNLELTSLHLPNLEIAGEDFLRRNTALKTLSLPKLNSKYYKNVLMTHPNKKNLLNNCKPKKENLVKKIMDYFVEPW